MVAAGREVRSDSLAALLTAHLRFDGQIIFDRMIERFEL